MQGSSEDEANPGNLHLAQTSSVLKAVLVHDNQIPFWDNKTRSSALEVIY